ncbi:MAG TPA: 7TM diverse intracellular signaling domain-containing protein [Rhodocyclaceae bacterium]|nr:7TM diverse intracellular signaling domain-containing protein [Rhodocyclaceae bacterium]
MRSNILYRYLTISVLCGLFLSTLSTLATFSAFAADKALDVASSSRTPISLTEYFAVLEDPSLRLTLDDLRKPETAARFKTGMPAAEALSYGYTPSAYWLRLQLRNAGDRPVERMLEIAYARLSHIQLHYPDADGGYRSIATGGNLPFATRAYPNRHFAFPLALPARAEQTIYLRIHATGSLLAPVRLWETPAFHAYERNDYMTQAWYFGMATAMILFNLLLFFALRDIVYVLYIGFVACMALSLSAQNGLAKEFLWPNATLWADISTYVGFSLSIAWLIAFMRAMLNTWKIIPRFDRLLKLLMTIHLIFPLGFVAALQLFAKYSVLLNLTSMMFVLGASTFCAYKRYRSAYFFVAAFAIFILGAVMFALRILGVLPTNVLTVNGIQFGSALEMILLALALADRFNEIRREKEMAQKDAMKAQSEKLQAEQRLVENLRSSEKLLEGKVSERTAELSATIDRLKQTQHELVQADKLASLGALVAGVAHELNTPIGNALTTATTLEDSAKELEATMARGEMRRSTLIYFVESTVSMAELITRSCQRAGTLINSFKQVAVDQTSEQRRRFNLRSLVDDNIAALRPSFRHAPWIIETDIPANIQCDSYPGPLGQIIANLVQNAVAHAFEGCDTGTLNVSAVVANDGVEMVFSDNGIGMDRTVLAHIFEPFYTRRLGQGGSGLGLSISLNIATGVLGGSLHATSEPGCGSRFILRFPLTAPNQAPPTNDAA